MTANGDRKRVAVIGAGLISQAMHLPHLALLRDRFELAVVADPSRTVRERVGDRFGIPARVATASEAIAHPGLHGVVVGTPNATPFVKDAFHAAIVAGSNTPRLKVLLRAMSSIFPGNLFEEVPGTLDDERQGQAAIVRALGRGDGDRAANEYATTMESIGARVTKFFYERGIFAATAAGTP